MCSMSARGAGFFHNVHSVRVLDVLYGRNLTLQVLDGALCHNGEYEQRVFELSGLSSFDELDAVVERCYTQGDIAIGHLRPMTLEGCVVRVSDIIAYVGRDRQDAIAAGLLDEDALKMAWAVLNNSWVLSHASVDIIEHSYGKNRIEMSEDLFAEIRRAKAENYAKIYRSSGIEGDQLRCWREPLSLCMTALGLTLPSATPQAISLSTISPASSSILRITGVRMRGRTTSIRRWWTISQV